MAQPRTTEPPQKKQKLSPDCTDQKSEDRELIAYTEEYVKKELAGQDGVLLFHCPIASTLCVPTFVYLAQSHDFFHIIRVRNTALQLAEQENNSGNPCNMLVVELAALLHDIKDWKYSGSETAGVEAVREFLQIAGCKASIVVQVVYVVEHVGFKGELGRLQSGKQQAAIPAELAVVQARHVTSRGCIPVVRIHFMTSGRRSARCHRSYRHCTHVCVRWREGKSIVRPERSLH